MERIYELLKTEMLMTENLAYYLYLHGESEASNYLNAGVCRLKKILAEFEECIRLQKISAS
jgi:hypothetical protein